jgi:hypothetical protein
MTMDMAELTCPSDATDRVNRLLDRALIYGSFILIPYDLPLVHQACVPLAALAILLLLSRGDLAAFLAFMREFPVTLRLFMGVCLLALISLYGNINVILGSTYQSESGWMRGMVQVTLLFITAVYPFYLAFCLRRHADWKSMVISAAWWSLPLPLLVGLLQIANLFGVHAFAHLPYVGGASGAGAFRITSVAREASWFGSFTCVVLLFLLMSVRQIGGFWRKLAGWGGIALLLLIFLLGISKSSYAGLALEGAIVLIAVIVIRHPWRAIGKVFLGLVLLGCAMFTLAIVAPAIFGKVVAPLVNKATMVYQLFEPLLLGDTNFISIGTRFGMSAAGISMGGDHPVVGVGLGQFGFHVYNYFPLWGLNSETIGWLSNDQNAWPSTSNLYTRLLAETGALCLILYVAFRLILMLGVFKRLLCKDSPAWWRDISILAIMSGLVVFDFHRDSFINLDLWAATGMALAAMHESRSARPAAMAERGNSDSLWRVFGLIGALSFAAVFAVALSRPASYQATAMVVPKSNGVAVSPGSVQSDTPSIAEGGDPNGQFKLLRTFWGSRSAAARILADQPGLVREILKSDKITPSSLVDYISGNIVVLMQNNETTLIFQYRNADAALAERFLEATIDGTDRAIAAQLAVRGAQASQLTQLALARSPDIATRQSVLGWAAAQELQSNFDTAGEYVSFDYVEHPAVSDSANTPDPVHTLIFALLLAALTGSLAVGARMLWPNGVQGVAR